MTQAIIGISQAIKDKLIELVILLDEENQAGRSSVLTCAVLMDIGGQDEPRIAMQLTGNKDNPMSLSRMVKALLSHINGIPPEPNGNDRTTTQRLQLRGHDGRLRGHLSRDEHMDRSAVRRG